MHKRPSAYHQRWSFFPRVCMRGRQPSTKKLAVIALSLLALILPLYINRKQLIEPEADDGNGSDGSVLWLPRLLIFLIMAINILHFLDRRFTWFDPHWIHRDGGSSGGMVAILLILALVLKGKASEVG
ncbi:putative transmembrane protein [Cinnamomum micranthum f. kanehirae]|uniref:Putative transmembrane protein n=1 Tax=Cinnamomum micranthum f. kanehirae TaxID=337451 RepID=A0A443N045_9MAGN|nr:putative transmembrane protein [Cinnamomum micranthum f. kanehirae]